MRFYTLFLSFAFACCHAYAGNGALAYALPVSSIEIDGNLADWPESTVTYPVDIPFDDGDSSDLDLAASFMVSYNETSRRIYVAVVVRDDSYHCIEGAEDDWLRQDGLLIYFDRDHLPYGSGSVLYMLGHSYKEIHTGPAYFDPLNAGADWSSIEYEINRSTDQTVYELAFELRPDQDWNQVYGIDFMIVDQDESEEESSGLLWGSEFGKSRFAGRLGDLVLLDSGQEVYPISGSIAWVDTDLDYDFPRTVRIMSQSNSDWFIEAEIDSMGNFQTHLPIGDYKVFSPFCLTNYGEYDPSLDRLRYDDRKSLSFSVKDTEVHIPPLELAFIHPPVYLYPDQAILPNYSETQVETVDNFVESFRQYYNIPGASVGIVKSGQLVYHRNFGTASQLSRQPVSDTTLFQAASITKPVFAFAVMRYAERGLIDLDKPLYTYLPFNNIANDDRSKLLTARMVLCHRSGLPNWAFGGPFGYMNGQEIELNFEPGTAWGYSGEAYNYLGRVMEAIADKPLAEILEEEVTQVMKMEQTWFAGNPKLNRRSAVGHQGFWPTFWETIGAPSPASSMYTQAGDFSKFMIGLYERRGLQAETYALWLDPQHTIPTADQSYPTEWPQELSLGLFTRQTAHGRIYEHGGNNGDFHCKFGLLTESGDGYVIFTNSTNGERLVRAFELLMLEGYPNN